MVISIHQPDYIPYWGFFYKISQADRFVFLDDCQFSNDNMHHWNKIKTPQGVQRLKVPVAQHLGDSIHRVRTRDELGWKQKHLRALEMNYSKAAYYQDIYPAFQAILCQNYANIADMNIAINRFVCAGFGFTPEFFKSSELDVQTVNEARVIDICAMLGGDSYLSGNGAWAYQREEHFMARGIRLTYTDYQPFSYPQLWGAFESNLSILDYLFNCGFTKPDFSGCIP